MTNETPKNTPKLNSFSNPSALTNGKASPAFPGGGVCGRSKLKMPSAREKPAPSRNIWFVEASRNVPRIHPAAIHPIVPRTRKPGKSRPPSGT